MNMLTHQEAKQRVAKLKAEIEHHRYLYHVLDKIEISDAALDSLKHELYQLEQQFPDLLTPDSPTQRVGGEPLPAFKKVRHSSPMLSIEDVFTTEELADWLERIKKILPFSPDFYAEVKMDGLAVSLVYKNGLLKTGATRGDGVIGEDVTQNLKTIEAIPLRLRVPNEKEVQSVVNTILRGEVEIRGEAYMTKKVFDELNREQKKKGEPPFANPRNVAAGSIRQLDSKIMASRRLDFFAYALMTDFGQTTHEQSHELMRHLGFKTNPLNRHCRDLKEVEKFHEEIRQKRPRLPYWTDGIVAVVNDNQVFEKLGVVGKTPRGLIAYKFPAEQSTTRVLAARWQVGRTGVLTPVAVMEPTQVGGTTVQHATLHNQDEIERLGVRIGDTVILEKAGDIIPKIVNVLPNLRTGQEKIIHAPAHCPVCGEKTERKEGEVAIVCPNKNCPAKHHERILHFVSKKAFNIDGLGDKIVKQLMDEGLISTPADIYKLTKSDLVDLERFGEKSADNLLVAIDKSRKVDLARFIYGLGIKHAGEETALDLANRFGTLKKIRKATFEEFNAVPNIGEVVAQSLHKYFSDKHNQKLIDDLLDAGVQVTGYRLQVTRQSLKGLTFVLTGALESMSREQAKEKIRELGGDVSSSVSKNTSYVVAGAEPGEKYDKAKRLGVKIIDEGEFIKMVR